MKHVQSISIGASGLLLWKTSSLWSMVFTIFHNSAPYSNVIDFLRHLHLCWSSEPRWVKCSTSSMASVFLVMAALDLLFIWRGLLFLALIFSPICSAALAMVLILASMSWCQCESSATSRQMVRVHCLSCSTYSQVTRAASVLFNPLTTAVVQNHYIYGS